MPRLPISAATPLEEGAFCMPIGGPVPVPIDNRRSGPRPSDDAVRAVAQRQLDEGAHRHFGRSHHADVIRSLDADFPGVRENGATVGVDARDLQQGGET